MGAASCVTLAPLGLPVAGDVPGAAADLNAAREAWCPPREGVSSAANCVVIDVMRLMTGASVETSNIEQGIMLGGRVRLEEYGAVFLDTLNQIMYSRDRNAFLYRGNIYPFGRRVWGARRRVP